MANMSCSFEFPSINDLLAQAEAGQANITTVVSTCEGICSMAWGAGNPDLSGIGLIICYVLQAVLTVLFGPLFCVFYYHFHDDLADGTKTKLGEKLEELHDTFLDTIAQFSIPVAVATVIRFHQNPPFYEIDFMHSLTTMQLLSLLATAVTAGIFGPSDNYKSTIRIIVICIYGLFDFGFYMGLVGGLRTSAARWEAINELGNACQAYGTLLPGFEAIQKLRSLLPHANWHWSLNVKEFFEELFLGFTFKSETGGGARTKALFIIIALIVAALVSLAIVVGVMWLLWNIFREWEGIACIGPIGLMSLGLSIGTLVELVRMQQTRTIMQHIAGPDFADNQWGFGQVVSLFLWVPVCAQAIYYCLFVPIIETGPMQRLIQPLKARIATLFGPMQWLIRRLDAIINTLSGQMDRLIQRPNATTVDDKKPDVGNTGDTGDEKAGDEKADGKMADDERIQTDGSILPI
ncbi:hypothetical protein FIBSPDRAFT_1044839 [Athelia psychrophila]|uniref:Uncharacterized protein n=1 Tax=Athelia psychrophila TaxID=1759441 RepID=A0A166J813_9AGAM|nr:hypothetical protein FIBSPDRAFT_1044839 [Fibularhizoctonia sp. CBS 109695]